MRRLLILLAAACLLPSLSAAGPTSGAGDAALVVTRTPAEDAAFHAEARMCGDRREAADRAEGPRLKSALAELIRRAAAGADPVADARRAAAEGRFGLIQHQSLGNFAPVGMDCRVPWTIAGSFRHPLHLATRHHSDLIVQCPDGTAGPSECARYRDLDPYALAYNRALVADPRFPYPDLCPSPVKREGLRISHSLNQPEFLAISVPETATPRNLGEAARRGTPASLAALIARHPADVDRPDDFGLTPLAWAAIRDRPEAAARLLAAGANPLRQTCDHQWLASPLRLAIVLGRRDVAARMLKSPQVKALRAWPAPLMSAAAKAGDARLLRRMLSEPHEPISHFNVNRPPAAPPTTEVDRVIADWESRKCWSAPIPANAEIQIASTYRPKAGAPEGGFGPIDVWIDARRRPLILALSSYNAAEWRLTGPGRGKVAGVLILGYEPQQLVGAPPRAPVLLQTRESYCLGVTSAAGADQDEGLSKLNAQVSRLIDRTADGAQAKPSASEFRIPAADGWANRK